MRILVFYGTPPAIASRLGLLAQRTSVSTALTSIRQVLHFRAARLSVCAV
jgi:hypothetical protein